MRASIPLAALLFTAMFSGPAATGECVNTNRALESMQFSRIELSAPDRSPVELTVRVADEAFEQRAGFQHICPESVAEHPILFVFQREMQRTFHMQNVHAALDIAFIDRGGEVVDIQTMQPYVAGARRRPVYSSNTVVKWALETEAGFFARHGFEAGRASVRIVGH